MSIHILTGFSISLLKLSEGEIKKILISIGIIFLFVILRKIFTKYIFQLILKISQKTPTELFSQICLAFERPLSWLFIIAGLYISIDFFPYLEQNNQIVMRLLRSSIIFLIAWGLYNVVSSADLINIINQGLLNNKLDQIIIPFISRIIKFLIVAFSISIIAQEFNYDINGLIAGLGIGGLAFALAAKDVLGNLFGGFVIVTEKPFSIGEWILTPSVEGIVEDITFRSTKIRTFDQALVTVPNATLAAEPITNWSRMEKRRYILPLAISLDTPEEKIELLIKKIKGYLEMGQEIISDSIVVAIEQYNEHSINLMVRFYVEVSEGEDFVKFKHDTNLNIRRILEEENVSLATPKYISIHNGISKN